MLQARLQQAGAEEEEVQEEAGAGEVGGLLKQEQHSTKP